LAIERMAREAGLSLTQGHVAVKPGMKSIGGGFGYFEKTKFFYDSRAEVDGTPTHLSPSIPSGYRGGLAAYTHQRWCPPIRSCAIASPV
jgi:hypothetical protein